MFDKEKCPIADLETQLVGDATRIASSTAAWLLLLGAFDRRQGWAGHGIRSCAHWLSWKVGLGIRTAHEYLRVARVLETLPVLREQFLAGRLSYAKVRALARVATPADEADLVALARSMPAAHLERLVRSYRTVTKDEASARQRNRRVSWRYDDDGNFLLHARLPPEDGAVVAAAITAATDKLNPPPDPNGEDPARPGTQTQTRAGRADGLIALAETFLGGQSRPRADPDRYTTIIHTDAPTEPATGRPAAEKPDARPDPEPVDNAHLGTPVAAHHEIEDGPALDPATIDRLTCGSGRRILIRHRTKRGQRRGAHPGAPIGPGETLIDLGRRTRRPNAALRRAVYHRDHGHCQYPACTNSQFTDIHHVAHWHPDGRTDLANLITLCRWHHRDHHEGSYTITVAPDGSPTFRKPDGSPIAQAPQPPALTDDQTTGDQNGRPEPDPTAITPDWKGDRLDLGYTIAGLLHHHPKAA